MADQAGRTYVVTGATSGLGLVTARALASRGARVLMAVRDVERGEGVAADIRQEVTGAQVEIHYLDLLDLESVRSAARAMSEQGVDVLINNAGISMVPQGVSATGVETHLAANHLGHFVLAALLAPALREAHAPRVVTVTSYMHDRGSLDLTDPSWTRRPYKPLNAYAASKLANAAFGVELARREAAERSPILSVLAHPGYSNTPMQRKGTGAVGLAMRVSGALFAQSPAMGALPQLYAATEPGLEQGTYVGPGGRGGRSGYPELATLSQPALDPLLGAGLWDLSETHGSVDWRASAS